MFSKAQIAKLAVEDQELLAEMELSKTRRREKLLEQARGLDLGSRFWPFYVFAIFTVIAGFYYFDFLNLKKKPLVLCLLVGVTFVNALIFHIKRINKRLDALLELLDFDRKNQGDSNCSKDETAG